MAEVRLIDANALNTSVALYMAENAYLNDTPLDILKMVSRWIAEAPTIDAVPVVRCRNCRLWRRTEKHYGKCPFLIGENQFTSEDGFCNLGAKMEGGAE